MLLSTSQTCACVSPAGANQSSGLLEVPSTQKLPLAARSAVAHGAMRDESGRCSLSSVPVKRITEPAQTVPDGRAGRGFGLVIRRVR
jgi:hypothetical protein